VLETVFTGMHLSKKN